MVSKSRRIDYKQQILYLENKCIKCKTCEHIAENDAIKFVDDKMNLNRQQDSNWLQVIEECPTRALQFDSKYYNLPEIMQEITKDEAFLNMVEALRFLEESHYSNMNLP